MPFACLLIPFWRKKATFQLFSFITVTPLSWMFLGGKREVVYFFFFGFEAGSSSYIA